MNISAIYRRLWRNDIAIDLGTVNTVIYRRDEGIVLNEPSALAYSTPNGAVIAIGRAAQAMAGKTPPGIDVSWPLQQGVITDIHKTMQLLRGFLQRLHIPRLWRPRVIIAIPYGSTSVERKAVLESGDHLGARMVALITEPMAAALGVGIDVTEPMGNMLVDIGGGTTEIVVIALNGIVLSKSIRIAGRALDHAIIDHLKDAHHFVIGPGMAEQVKQDIGSALPGDTATSTVQGRDLISGHPRQLIVSSDQVYTFLEATLGAMVHAIQTAFERLPPEFASDILDRGVILTGGGALLHQLDTRLRRENGVSMRIAEQPVFAVVRGAGRVLDDLRTFRSLLIETV